MSDNTVTYETDVLVVGTGPAGSTTALALARVGVRCVVVNRYGWTCRTPRAHITNPRTMEVLTDLGVIDQVKLYAVPSEFMGENVVCRSLAGAELGRTRTWGSHPDRGQNYAWGTPEENVDLPQNFLENILLGSAAHQGAKVFFNTEFLGFEQDSGGVTSQLVNRLTGQELTVRSQFLVGADGANSTVAEQAGLPFEGEKNKVGMFNIVINADLTRFVEHRPSSLYWMVQTNETTGFPEIGALRMVRPWHRWLCTWQIDLDNRSSLGHDEALAHAHRMIGDDTVEVDVDSVSLWTFNEEYATHLQSGRVFCAGDAVHRHPPLKGLGSNTSIQDGYNLAWKLAMVIQGTASPSLLDSYSEERAPVAKEVAVGAFQSRRYLFPIFGALISVSRGADPTEAERSLTALSDNDPATAELRSAITNAIAGAYRAFDCPGIEMNHRYDSVAVATPDGESMPPYELDPEDWYQPTSFPGAHLPHGWVFKAGRKTSLLYLCGDGRFTLLTGNSGIGWVDAARAAEAAFGIRMVVRVIGPGQEHEDLYGDFARISEVHESGALLVRPDVHVGWRCQRWSDDAADGLMAALGAIVGRQPGEFASTQTVAPSATEAPKFDDIEIHDYR